jgi:hypothetical protein
MEDNPELERAEVELAERVRREREAERRRPHAQWTDYAIFFAAALYFITAVGWVGFFLLALPFMLLDNATRLFIPWLCALPGAGVSLGIACALDRVLDLTSPVRLRQSDEPKSEPAGPA